MPGMAKFRVVITLLLIALAGIVMRVHAGSGTETWIARVSIRACGAMHSGPGHADCIRKCARGGAAIGHPEWKPQPLVLVKEEDQSVWTVDNPTSLIGFEGEKVRAVVKADAAKKTVHIDSVAENK
jgi:hypothetical protein